MISELPWVSQPVMSWTHVQEHLLYQLQLGNAKVGWNITITTINTITNMV